MMSSFCFLLIRWRKRRENFVLFYKGYVARRISMSTRCSIAMQLSDGRVTGIYCHWAGDIHQNGVTLYKHYQCTEKIQALIALGHLSSLGAELAPDPAREHSWQNSQKDVCVAFHRDRGDSWENVAPVTACIKEFYETQCQEVDYLWRDDAWWVSSAEFIDGEYTVCHRPLREAI